MVQSASRNSHLYSYTTLEYAFKLMVDSVYVQFLMGTEMTVILRHNYI